MVVTQSPLVRKKILFRKILEDNITLLQIIKNPPESPDALRMPVVEVMSFFAVQPSKDVVDAAKTLHRVTSQQGVELSRDIFSVQLEKEKKERGDPSHTALMIVVRVYQKFHLRHEKLLPFFLRKARKHLARRRSLVHSMLEGTGCKVTLVTGEKKIFDFYYRKKRISEGITVFKGNQGFYSKITEAFLRLDRVPSRQFQDYVAPDLPVVHRVGARMDNPSLPVGFPEATLGTLLVCGSKNSEVVSVLQQLISSLSTTGFRSQIFVIDTHNEFNHLIQQLQARPPNTAHLQVFRLGVNLYINLCDVISPKSPSGKKQELKARAAWRAHLISQILLSSIHTSEYLSSRYAIPLESQIRRTATKNHNFTLREVTLNIGGGGEEDLENPEGSDIMFSDMMTLEAITGILEQLQAFPEVNYASFEGHYSDNLIREGTITFFQFGAQPPLIRRATIAFLLHNLSQTMNDGCVVLTHAAEFLRRQSSNKYDQEHTPSIVLDAYNTLTAQNVVLLGTRRLQSLTKNFDSFDEIKNCLYLKMANDEDRELVFTRHELDFARPFSKKTYTYRQQRFLGIIEGEGLLFREDAPQNVGFHCKLDSPYPLDLNPVVVPEVTPRGSETLGLSPARYEILMKLLKLLVHQPCRKDEALALIEGRKQGELSLNQFQSLGLYEIQLEGGVTYCVITKKGRNYYKRQHDRLNSLPVPLDFEEVKHSRQELDRLESFYDISDSQAARKKTNEAVKHLVGRLLSYLRQLRATSIPWMRIAEYYDLEVITSLEWQDFRHLFDLANSLVNNLLLEITHLHRQQSQDAVQQTLQASTIRCSKSRDLNDFLPEDNFTILQQLSRELGLDPYPETGILDLYFALHAQGRSLFEELRMEKQRELTNS